MISVLICSADKSFLQQITANIAETIGIEHEILVFDNAIEKKGICFVYNSLASRAKFPYLCFVHEDILFVKGGWGLAIADIYRQRPDIGVIGIAGSKYKSKLFSGWFSGIREFDCANITHKYRKGDELILLKPHATAALEEVVCLDGVFICSTKKIWGQSRFEEKKLPGFHFYDIDFSLRASHLCTVAVSYEIEVMHITTGGDFGNNWVETAIQYHSGNADNLPETKLVGSSGITERRISKTWLDILKKYDISWRNKVRWIRLQKLHLSPALYYSIAKFLFYKPLGLSHVHKLFRKVK